MEKIVVQLKDRSYPIIISNNLFSNPHSFFWPLQCKEKVVIITSDRIAPIFLNNLSSILKKMGVLVDNLILPDGEKSKSLSVLNIIFTKLLSQNCDRSTILIALGGGVIGDLTGFAAAIYQRGIRFIQVPTTLLAQVDASIGGKTGVNHILGKNMIGSFHQPIAVIIDVNMLNTLTIKEFTNGLAEIIKYAVACDACLFDWLENNLDLLLRLDMNALIYCIRRCCELKASIVEADECDINIRNVLNLGHTYGHAIESYLSYSMWSHGEAVAAGIMMAIQTSLILGKFNFNDAERVKMLLLRAKLPVYGPKEMQSTDYLFYMERDKKIKSGRINLVLPVSIGVAQVFENIERDVILSSILNRSEITIKY